MVRGADERGDTYAARKSITPRLDPIRMTMNEELTLTRESDPEEGCTTRIEDLFGATRHQIGRPCNRRRRQRQLHETKIDHGWQMEELTVDVEGRRYGPAEARTLRVGQSMAHRCSVVLRPDHQVACPVGRLVDAERDIPRAVPGVPMEQTAERSGEEISYQPPGNCGERIRQPLYSVVERVELPLLFGAGSPPQSRYPPREPTQLRVRGSLHRGGDAAGLGRDVQPELEK